MIKKRKFEKEENKSNKSNKPNKQDITECCNKIISNDISHKWGPYQFKDTCIYCQSINIIDKHTIYFIEQDNQKYENYLMENEDIDIQEQPCSKTYFRDDYMVECEKCGRIWDGHAQCDCWLFYLSDSD